MTPPANPPRRRNAQIRTYSALLQCAIKRDEVTDADEARIVLKQLSSANAKLARSTRDALRDIDVPALVSRAHELLGFSASSLLQPQEVAR